MASIERLNSLRETAALWHERAGRGSASAESSGALNSWLGESPEHAAAFRSVDRAWSALQNAAQTPEILELRQETARRLASNTRRPLRWTVAALILVSLGTLVWMIVMGGSGFSSVAWLKGESRNPTTKTYATKTGDRLTVALDDGSQITLNTDTRLDVGFSRKARTVRLSRGQALFEVAKDASRPFMVENENHRFVAVGTVFDVHIETDQVKVTMLEGTVRAESLQPGRAVRTIVTAGEQLIANSRAEDRIRRVDSERETSWRRGQVIFDNTPLGEALDELNRYSTRHIELADPKLTDLRLSGTFATGATSAFVEAITAYFPIQVAHADEHTVTLEARGLH